MQLSLHNWTKVHKKTVCNVFQANYKTCLKFIFMPPHNIFPVLLCTRCMLLAVYKNLARCAFLYLFHCNIYTRTTIQYSSRNLATTTTSWWCDMYINGKIKSMFNRPRYLLQCTQSKREKRKKKKKTENGCCMHLC